MSFAGDATVTIWLFPHLQQYLHLQQVLVMAVTVWLARWSRQDEKEQERSFYAIVLALLALAAVAVSLLRAVLAFFSLVKVPAPQ